MKLIDKYLLRNLMAPLGYCLTAFAMVYIIGDLFNNMPDFIDAKTPLASVIKFYALLMPSALIYIVPVSLFLAVLYSLSHLTKNNELTAMRSCGVSLLRLMVPMIAVGLTASLIVGVINETIGPWSAYWTNQFIKLQRSEGELSVRVVSMLGLVNEVAGRDWIVEKFDTQTFEMSNATLTKKQQDGTAERIQARQAHWLDGRWWLEELVTQNYDRDGNPMGPPQFELRKEMKDVSETPTDFINEIKDPEYLSAREILNFIRTHRLSNEKIAQRKVDFHSRLAMPWVCLVVTLLGIPFGAQTGRKGALIGIVLALSLFFGLYFLMNVGVAFGKKGAIDPWLAGWLPNIFFFCLGCVMVYRMR
jgi:lipopolysaccharide export system permease protein